MMRPPHLPPALKADHDLRRAESLHDEVERLRRGLFDPGADDEDLGEFYRAAADGERARLRRLRAAAFGERSS